MIVASAVVEWLIVILFDGRYLPTMPSAADASGWCIIRLQVSSAKRLDLTALMEVSSAKRWMRQCQPRMDFTWSTLSVFLDLMKCQPKTDLTASSVQFLLVRPQGERSCESFDCNNGTNRCSLKRAFQRWSYCIFCHFNICFENLVADVVLKLPSAF